MLRQGSNSCHKILRITVGVTQTELCGKIFVAEHSKGAKPIGVFLMCPASKVYVKVED